MAKYYYHFTPTSRVPRVLSEGLRRDRHTSKMPSSIFLFSLVGKKPDPVSFAMDMGGGGGKWVSRSTLLRVRLPKGSKLEEDPFGEGSTWTDDFGCSTYTLTNKDIPPDNISIVPRKVWLKSLENYSTEDSIPVLNPQEVSSAVVKISEAQKRGRRLSL